MAGKNISGNKVEEMEKMEDLISRKEAIEVVNDIIDKTAVRTKDLRKLELVKGELRKLKRRN
jgi:hypothetical protein